MGVMLARRALAATSTTWIPAAAAPSAETGPMVLALSDDARERFDYATPQVPVAGWIRRAWKCEWLCSPPGMSAWLLLQIGTATIGAFCGRLHRPSGRLRKYLLALN